jgi:hypothetical protein
MCTYVVALACSLLGSWIVSDVNKLSRNISSDVVHINDLFLCAQFVAERFLRENLSLRM